MFCQRLVPSRTSEPLNVLPEASAGPTGPNRCRVCRRAHKTGAHLDRRNHPTYCQRPVQDRQDLSPTPLVPCLSSCHQGEAHISIVGVIPQRPVQDTQDLNLNNNAPQPQPRFLHANDDLTSEIRYTARGRLMSCLPCAFPPQQRCQSAKQPSPSSSNPLHPCLVPQHPPQHHRCQWSAGTYA